MGWLWKVNGGGDGEMTWVVDKLVGRGRGNGNGVAGVRWWGLGLTGGVLGKGWGWWRRMKGRCGDGWKGGAGG